MPSLSKEAWSLKQLSSDLKVVIGQARLNRLAMEDLLHLLECAAAGFDEIANRLEEPKARPDKEADEIIASWVNYRGVRVGDVLLRDPAGDQDELGGDYEFWKVLHVNRKRNRLLAVDLQGNQKSFSPSEFVKRWSRKEAESLRLPWRY